MDGEAEQDDTAPTQGQPPLGGEESPADDVPADPPKDPFLDGYVPI